MNETELIQLINEWIYHNQKLREITQYLYEKTELFEKRYEHNFNQNLYDFFANKITVYAKTINNLYTKLDEKQKAKLAYIKLLDRR